MELKYSKRKKLLKIAEEWRWMAAYMRRYRAGIVFYIIVGLSGVLMGLCISVAQKDLINAVTATEKLPAAIVRAAAGVIALAVTQIFMNALGSWVSAHINIRVVNEVRADIFRRIIASRWEGLAGYHSGDLINRLEGDVNTVAGGAVGFLPTLLTRLCQFLGAFVIILSHDPTMAVLALLSAPVLLLSGRPLLRIMRGHNERTREINGRILSFGGEVFRDMGLVKAFDLGQIYCERLGALLREYRTVRLAYSRVSVIMSVLLGLVGLVAGYGCYGWGVYRLYMGVIDYGEMTLFLSLSGTLASSFSALVRTVPGAVSVATAARRIMEVTTLPAECDADAAVARRMAEDASVVGVRIAARSAAFRYRRAEREVLTDVSFDIEPGETVALVGPSGGGKTTLLCALLGLLSPTAGSLQIISTDGREALLISESTRRLCTYVPQGNGVFTGSVRDNLCLVAPEATDAELWAALRLADAEGFVEALPGGLDAHLSENGRNLSEGQRQRLCIARAALRHAPILILDEATAALDAESEARILRNLMADDPCRICLFSTHRPGMLAYADRILRVDGGRVESIENQEKTQEKEFIQWQFS